MNVGYILYNYTEEMMSVAQWGSNLLPVSWTSKSPQLKSDQQVPFLLGRILLYQQLTHLGYGYGDMPKMYYDSSDIPVFKEKLYFDISYTKGMVMVATSSQQQMGIKVEQIRPISPKELNSYFSPREWLFINKMKLSSSELVRSWVSREAAAKLIRDRKYRLHEINFKRKKIKFDKNQIFYNTSLNLPNNYLGQLVSKKSCKFLKTQNITPQMGSMLRIIRA